LLLIFVENHSINHHVFPRANVVDSDRDADFHSRPYDIFIEHFTAPRHVVVVSETCTHAKGAAIARAILSNIFFTCVFPLLHELIEGEASAVAIVESTI
jgi:hypothetical protein